MCILLFSCSLPLVLASEFESLLHGEGRRQPLHSPRVRSSPRRRAQEDDKDNDKDNDKNNDKDATPVPSALPSLSPAPTPSPTIQETLTAYPTITPWPTVTPYPTTSPYPTITPYPTVEPTFSTVGDSVGNLVMELSVSDPTVTAADVSEGRANTLLDGVLAGLLEVQCRIHYIMVLDNSVDGTRACPDASSSRALQPVSEASRDDYPVVWTMSRVNVEDYQDEKGNALLYWQVAFPVLEIGAAYSNWAVGQGAKATEEEEVSDTALNGMYEDAYYATQKYIQRGYMDQQLPETATAVADPSATPVPAPGAVPSEQLDPHPLHPMRVAGIILLLVTVLSTFILVKLSARRKKERDLDNAIAKINKGGLVTEEGLDLMLDVGRKESEKAGMTSTEIEVVLLATGQQQQEEADTTKDSSASDGEEQNRMLPMPGYLNDTSMSSSAPGIGVVEGSKEGAVLQAAKDSASDVNKTYSFLSIFGSHDEDSEPEDHVVLPPHGPNDGVEVDLQEDEPLRQTIAGFMSMFSGSTGDSSPSSVGAADSFVSARGSQVSAKEGSKVGSAVAAGSTVSSRAGSTANEKDTVKL